MLAPWKKSMIKPDSILKSIDITLPAKVHLVKSMDFPVVLYGRESWTVKKAEHLGRWKFSPPTEHSWKFSSVQSLSRVRLFVTSWTAAHQASLSFNNSWSLLKLMSIKSVMPCNHLIVCRSLLLLPSIFPSIRVFSSESVLCIRWPKYWRFSFSPSHEYSELISSRID